MWRKSQDKARGCALVPDSLTDFPNAHSEMWTPCSLSPCSRHHHSPLPPDRGLFLLHSFPQNHKNTMASAPSSPSPLQHLIRLTTGYFFNLLKDETLSSLHPSSTLLFQFLQAVLPPSTPFLGISPRCMSSTPFTPFYVQPNVVTSWNNTLFYPQLLFWTLGSISSYMSDVITGVYLCGCKSNVSKPKVVALWLPMCKETCYHQTFSFNSR